MQSEGALRRHRLPAPSFEAYRDPHAAAGAAGAAGSRKLRSSYAG